MNPAIDIANRIREVSAQSLLTSGNRAGAARSGPSVQGPTSLQDDLSRSYIQNELRDCLSKVKYVGNIVGHRTSGLDVDPGLHIKDVGDIELPLESAGAKLILGAGRPATLSQDSETGADTSFKHTKQLDHRSFELRNPAWPRYVQTMIENLGVLLGCQGNPPGIEAKLQKLLLYEEDGIFKPCTHVRQTAGVFATLVICLPSYHQGGDLVLSGRGPQVTVKTSEASYSEQTHIAWFSDVVHEVQPVTAGYRLVLTYDLHRTQESCPASANIVVQERQVIRGILKRWKQGYEAKQSTINKLAYYLDRKYSNADLCFDRLMGRDHLLGRYLKEACGVEGFTLLLAKLTYTIHDAADPQRMDEDRKRDWTLDNLVDLDGHQILEGSVSIKHQEIVQQRPSDRLPDKIDSQETPAEGVVTAYTHQENVFILMPSAHLLDMKLATISNRSLINWMKSLIHQVDSYSSPSAKDDLNRICMREAQTFLLKYGNHGVFDGPPEDIVRQCIKACEALKSKTLLYKIAEGCAGLDLSPGVYEGFIETLHTLNFAGVQPSLDRLVSRGTRGRLLHPRLHMLEIFRRKLRLMTLSPFQLDQYQKWEKATTMHLIDSTNGAVAENALPLARVVEYFGEMFSIQCVFPLLIRNASKTNLRVGFLAEISKAVWQGRVPRTTGSHFLDRLLRPTVAKLSLKEFPSKDDSKAPLWHECPDVEKILGVDLGANVASLYCLCRAQSLEQEASWILAWLKREVDIASVSTFPYLFVPFLGNLLSNLNLPQHLIAISPEIQRTCVYLAFRIHARCIGDEPTRTSDWSRAPKGCKEEANCPLCPRLKAFLEHPRREAQIFVDNAEGHLRRQANYPLKVTKLRGSTRLKIQKTDYTFEAEHKKWQLRLDGARGKLGPRDGLRGLFGEREEELRRLFRF